MIFATVSRSGAGDFQPAGFTSQVDVAGPQTLEMTVDWVPLDAAEDMSTRLRGWNDHGQTHCTFATSPDRIPNTIEMLPFPDLAGDAEAGTAVVMNVPEGAHATLDLGSGAAAPRFIEVTGSNVLQLPQSVLDAFAGTDLLLKAGITDTLHRDHVQNSAWCEAFANGVRIEL